MRTQTIMKAMALVPMLAVQLGCGSSGTSGTTTAGANGTSTGTVTGTNTGGTTGTTSGGATGTTTGGTTGTTTGGAATSGSTTGSSIPGLGDACTFDVSTAADTCTTFGLECTSTVSWVFCEGLDYPCPPTASNAGGAGTCVLPEEIGPCAPSVGCQDGGTLTTGESDDFVCATGFSSGDICLYACSASTDCANISESCQTVGSDDICFYNYCDTNDQGQLVGPYFNACDASGTGDGECLSYGGVPPFGAVCYQNGSVAQGEVCNTYRTQGSNASQCVFGQFCVPQANNPNVGVCMQLTDEPGVPITHPCSDPSNLVWEDIIGADFAVCVPTCGDGGSCPANLSCQTIAEVGSKGCVP